jgi:hypothetical protein
MGTEIEKQQTKRSIVYFNCREREKKEKTKTIEHRWQFNHHKPTRATPCGREHDCASTEMADGQI